ncbi:MAG: tetratricopeptide repeat protein [Anaerolineae bacterium]|nr:tetratricopeptide repeat protein [Anaerolineae bacterium]
MSSPEDTQPVSPIKEPPPARLGDLIAPPTDDEPVRSGPGCFLYGIIGVGAVVIAVLIVLLAGAAGWTSGQRLSQQNATATQSARVNEQLQLVPGDIENGNTVMLKARVEYLLTLGVPNASELAITATALYLSVQPTITPTPEPTQADATSAPTEETTATATELPTLESASSGFDPAALLEDARQAVATAQYEDAIDLLDAIIRIDPSFETNTVRSLMLEALSTRALNLFRSGNQLAEAILLTDRAVQFGLSGDSDLLYEQYIATLYLNATSAIGTNYPAAIQALREIYSQTPNYADVQQLLFQQYRAYGDALAAGSDYCSAASQYQNALNMFVDGALTAKRDNAQQICEQGVTPVGTPGVGPDGTPIAPIGVPGT